MSALQTAPRGGPIYRAVAEHGCTLPRSAALAGHVPRVTSSSGQGVELVCCLHVGRFRYEHAFGNRQGLPDYSRGNVAEGSRMEAGAGGTVRSLRMSRSERRHLRIEPHG